MRQIWIGALAGIAALAFAGSAFAACGGNHTAQSQKPDQTAEIEAPQTSKPDKSE